VEKLVSTIRNINIEGDVRRCYAETSEISNDNYVKMILLNASFIIVHFLIFKHGEWGHCQESTVFLKQLLEDMLLLENQFPFFVIEELYNFAFASCPDYPSFTQLTFEFFAYYNSQKMSPHPNLKIMHFIDLLRTFFLPPLERLQEIKRGEKVMHLYNVSKLDEAGVKFKVGSSKCLFDLKITNEVLEIPCFRVYRNTDSFVRNLMALEQCHYISI
jgi:hypothetical protein